MYEREKKSMYIICDDKNNYLQLKDGKHGVTNDISKAAKWTKNKKAKNVIENICKTYKELKDFNWQVKNIPMSQITITQNEASEPSNEPISPIELNYDILEKVKEIHAFTKELEARKLYLVEELRNIDLEIVDIEHAAEFYNLNASQGYKLYKLLHNARVKRREIKDELQKIGLLLGSSMSSANMENLERSILGMDTRQYTPRINKELFGV